MNLPNRILSSLYFTRWNIKNIEFYMEGLLHEIGLAYIIKFHPIYNINRSHPFAVFLRLLHRVVFMPHGFLVDTLWATRATCRRHVILRIHPGVIRRLWIGSYRRVAHWRRCRFAGICQLCKGIFMPWDELLTISSVLHISDLENIAPLVYFSRTCARTPFPLTG